jgi:hypothetical protein
MPHAKRFEKQDFMHQQWQVFILLVQAQAGQFFAAVI